MASKGKSGNKKGKSGDKSKPKRLNIKLVSSAGTGHFYTTSKNNANSTGKLQIRKYDPVVKKHVMYKESKLR